MVTVLVTVDGNTRAGAVFRGSSGLVFGVRFREGFLGPEWGALERYVLVVCLEVAQFLTRDLEARTSWPAANSLNLSLLLPLGLHPARVGTAGVPEPGLMGSGADCPRLGLRTLWRRPSWVRIPPPAPFSSRIFDSATPDPMTA